MGASEACGVAVSLTISDTQGLPLACFLKEFRADGAMGVVVSRKNAGREQKEAATKFIELDSFLDNVRS